MRRAGFLFSWQLKRVVSWQFEVGRRKKSSVCSWQLAGKKLAEVGGQLAEDEVGKTEAIGRSAELRKFSVGKRRAACTRGGKAMDGRKRAGITALGRAASNAILRGLANRRASFIELLVSACGLLRIAQAHRRSEHPCDADQNKRHKRTDNLCSVTFPSHAFGSQPSNLRSLQCAATTVCHPQHDAAGDGRTTRRLTKMLHSRV